MSTHTEVILRALATYDNPAFGPGEVLRIINENQDSFQAGAPYPDAFYNTLCQEGNFHGRLMVSRNTNKIITNNCKLFSCLSNARISKICKKLKSQDGYWLFEDRPKKIDWIGCLVLLVARKT